MNTTTNPFDQAYLCVVAGGKGQRLYPLSHNDCPKQFCLMDGKRTFIQATVDRFTETGIKLKHVFIVVTSEEQRRLATQQLPGVPKKQILIIPDDFDFAGAMIEGTRLIHEKHPQAIVVSTPADHCIVDSRGFSNTVSKAVHHVSSFLNQSVLVGVHVDDIPTLTGCGHIRYTTETNESGVNRVIGFIEKPDAETAANLLHDGNTVCNTAITIWRADQIVKRTKNLSLTGGLATDKLFCSLLAPHADNPEDASLCTIIGDFQWQDCGTWQNYRETNLVSTNTRGNVCLGGGEISADSSWDCLFIAPGGYHIKTIGLRSTAVVVNKIDERLVVAIVDLKQSQLVKKLADQLSTTDMLHVTGIEAHNNELLDHMSDTAVGFVGVNHHHVYVRRYQDDDFTTITVINNAPIQ